MDSGLNSRRPGSGIHARYVSQKHYKQDMWELAARAAAASALMGQDS